MTPPMPSTDPTRLPPPGEEAAAWQRRVEERILAEMEEGGGPLPFRRFMELALYAPGLGYYQAGSEKLGVTGDFVTAPETSPLFGACVAQPVAESLEALGGGEVLEFGAGSGALAEAVLDSLARWGLLPDRYRILEVSPELRHRQEQRLRPLGERLGVEIGWIDALPAAGWRGVVLANEVLDAMPVHRFLRTAGGVEELAVTLEDGAFAWTTLPASPRLATAVEALESSLDTPLAPGYRTELNLEVTPWVGAIGDFLEAGAVLLLDYGYPRHEYYHPQRSDGTLVCHYRHRAHDDPLILVGIQDISAFVDFTAVAEAADAAGLRVAGFTSQAQFMIDAGLPELLAGLEARPLMERLRIAEEVKRLTLPGEMGERFKAMLLSRGLERPLRAFRSRQLLGRL